VAVDHNVRLLDDILDRMDWSPWEAGYRGRLGQPPIPPRVLTGAILYGLLTRIRSSRRLEEALSVRLDFMWLVEGRTINNFHPHSVGRRGKLDAFAIAGHRKFHT
jgi:transposase